MRSSMYHVRKVEPEFYVHGALNRGDQSRTRGQFCLEDHKTVVLNENAGMCSAALAGVATYDRSFRASRVSAVLTEEKRRQ